MSATAENRARAALEWAIEHTCLALPHDMRAAANWRWDADSAALVRLTGDGGFSFHVAAERRPSGLRRIAVLRWEDDDGAATWEAGIPADVIGEGM